MKNKSGQKYQVVQIYGKNRSIPGTYITAAQNDKVCGLKKKNKV